MRYLNLANNRLSFLPTQLCRLKGLTHLDVQNNRLCVLPPELSGMTQLKELIVVGNRGLASPPPRVVENDLPDIMPYLSSLLMGNIHDPFVVNCISR